MKSTEGTASVIWMNFNRASFLTIPLILIWMLNITACAGENLSGSGSDGYHGATYAETTGKPQDNLTTTDATLAGHPFHLKLARTASEKTKGLMFVKQLPEDEGMLFCYDKPTMMRFWMKNTLIPLDILFFSQDLRVLEIIESMEPALSGMPDHALPTYSSTQPVQYALELSAGVVKKLGIKPGDSLVLSLTLLFGD